MGYEVDIDDDDFDAFQTFGPPSKKTLSAIRRKAWMVFDFANGRYRTMNSKGTMQNVPKAKKGMFQKEPYCYDTPWDGKYKNCEW